MNPLPKFIRDGLLLGATTGDPTRLYGGVAGDGRTHSAARLGDLGGRGVSRRLASGDGGVVIPPAFGWNPADANGQIAVSPDGRTATAIAGTGYSGVRSVTSHTEGKYHVEVTMVPGAVASGSNFNFGVGQSNFSLSTYVGGSANSTGWFAVNGGGIYRNNQSLTPFTAFPVVQSTFGADIDVTNNTIIWRGPDGSFSDPYTLVGTGALFIGSINQIDSSTIINTGQVPFVLTPRPGYETPWG